MSNRLTFSLASLVLILAFVAMPVMAHNAEQSSGDPAVGPHAHPVKVPITEVSDASPPVLGVPLHGAHPTATISLKSGGTEAVVTSSAAEVTLVVQFDMPIHTSGDGTETAVDDAGLLEVDDFGVSIRDDSGASPSTGALITGTIPLAALNSVSGTNQIGLDTVRRMETPNVGTKFEVPLTIPADAIPGDDKDFHLIIRVNQGAGYGLQVGVPSDDGIGDVTVPGGESQASMETFTLVAMATKSPDTTAPMVDDIMASPLDMTTGNVTFTIAFNEAVVGFSLGDLEIENGMAVDFGVTSSTMYTVEVKPEAGKKVTVSFADDAMVADTTGNPLDVSMVDDVGVYTPEGYVPTVKITAAEGMGTAVGKVVFTLNFIEEPVAFSVASLNVTGAAALKVADLKMAMPMEGYAKTYTLTVTPTSGATEVKLSIAAGVLGTMAKNPQRFFEGAEGMHTLQKTDDSSTTDADDMVFTGTIPAKSYVIVAKKPQAMTEGLKGYIFPENTADGASATTVQPWAGMPNLEDLFARGGSLLLTTVKANKLDRDGKADTDTEEAKERDVVITEIMAALNKALVGQDGYKDHQWIEVYNKLPVSVTVNLSAKAGRPAPAAAATEVRLDLVSNVVNPGWNFSLGKDGFDNSIAANAAKVAPTLQPFTSFYRDNRGEPGWQQSRWKTSTDTYYPNHIGTPGAAERNVAVAVGATNPNYNVVINEIGNYENDAYDWIELRNTAGGTWNFKKWQLKDITGKKTDKTIVNIPDDDAYKAVPEIFLIVATDPYRDPNHPLAAGINITKDNGRLEKTGVKSSYYVAGTGFKLANSGKTLLLLRSRNDGGIHEGIVDLTGTDFITDTSNGFATDVWPLKGQAKGNDNHGHSDVVKGADEDFRAGHVYQRINAGRGTGKEVWERRGYTGVGYKRSARSTAQHGGTPGYDNGAVKVNLADLADKVNTVSISEIMYAKDRNLPQWIELYNSSMTQAVNLHEWKLRIENSRDADDVDIRTAVTTNNFGDNITIQPNQTVLIVSNTTGRVSRGAQDGIDFPSTRIVDLWKQKDKLEVPSSINRITYRLLSQTAFKLTLMDKSGEMIDTVGNLGADGTAMWELPMAAADEGRSSIIRRYDDGEPRDGTMAPPGDNTGAWVLASESPLAGVRVNETYYGGPDDIGTPGYRAGGPLPVSLSKFRPELLDDGTIVVRWITESELNNAGFNILRSDARNGQFTQMNTSLIKGQGTTSERTTYEWKDSTAKPNVVYYYQIQDVSLDGNVTTLRQSRLKGDISAAGKLTTTWGELKALQ